MLEVSDNYKYFAQRCVRHPILDVQFGFNRQGGYNDLESIKCDLMRAEWVSQADSPIASIVKSYADVTVVNNDGKYYQYLDTSFANCDGEVIEEADTQDVRPGLKMRLYEGFSYPTPTSQTLCDHIKDYELQFTGSSEKFPSYTTENSGNSLAQFHFTDNLQALLDSTADIDINYNGATVKDALQDWCTNQFPSVMNVPDPGNILVGNYTLEAGKPFSDILKYMIELNGGRFYQDVNGDYFYETNNYINNSVTVPDAILDTCNHVINTSTPSLDQIYNHITVQQFTNPGGIEYVATDQTSIDSFGLRPLVVTNPLIPDLEAAQSIANRVLSFYSQSTYDREIEIIGLGWLQVYDKVILRERVKNQLCETCKCQTLYSEVIYRITKVYSVHDSDGFRQKLTLTRSPLILNRFTFCETPTCNSQIGVIC